MISFFKYVEPNTFTLNGEQYSGMVNTKDTSVYTGAVYSVNSKLLSSTSTFFSRVIESKVNFNPTVSKSVPVSSSTLLQRDFLNYGTLQSVIDRLDYNNTLLYANQVAYNPNIFNVLSRTLDKQPYSYCLSSVNDSFNGNKLPLSRITATEPYKSTLSKENINNTVFVTGTSGLYTYFSNSVLMQGNVNSGEQPTFKPGLLGTEFDHKYIYFDQYKNILYSVNDTTAFTIYNLTPGTGCNILSLVDTIDISPTRSVINRKDVAFGYTHRTALVQEQGKLVLEVAKLRESTPLIVYTSEELGFDNIVQVVQRFEDDLLLIVGQVDSQTYISVYDTVKLTSSPTPISGYKVEGVSLTDTVTLESFDSDIFSVKRFDTVGSISSFELRSISNPQYPIVLFSPGPQLGFINRNNTINEVTDVINTSTIVLVSNEAESNNPVIYDIKFATGDSLNVLITFSDSYTIINNSIYLPLVPLLLPKRYTTIDIEDNSIGLNLNNTFKNIIFDTISLYTNCTRKFDYNNYTIVGIQPNVIPDINMQDVYMYENEYVNIGVLNRILNALYTSQYNLASTLNTTV
jgi:hypothetical protein